MSTSSPTANGPTLPRLAPSQVAIRDLLRGKAPSLAELYEGAVQILELRIPGWVRLVSHSVREIGNRLPDVMSSAPRPPRMDYASRLDLIARTWKPLPSIGPTQLPNPEPLPESTSIPYRLARDFDTLIREHLASRQTKSNGARALFSAISPENRNQVASIEPAVEQWLSVTAFFMRTAHDNLRDSDSACNAAEFQAQFQIFESALGNILREFYANISEIDEILENTNN